MYTMEAIIKICKFLSHTSIPVIVSILYPIELNQHPRRLVYLVLNLKVNRTCNIAEQLVCQLNGEVKLLPRGWTQIEVSWDGLVAH